MTARHHTQRGFDRLVNFSDAVVAIAITLLVLPLTDLEVGDQKLGAWDLLVHNSHAFTSFLITFVLVAAYWLIHHRIFEYLRDYDGAIIRLNLLWLLFIVLLPFLSYLMQESGLADGTGALYFGDIAALSILLGLIGHHASRHPELMTPEADKGDLGGPRGWVLGGYSVFLAVLSVSAPTVAGWGAFGLLFLSWAMRGRSRPPETQPSD
ncbi:MAG: TMEM175 family protein [Candidatus Nanopelagicales bacterium]|nr:TMEM175 family protein [Candidatus Nanopelagicales bacterium]